MKLLILALFVSVNLNAQTPLNFNKRFVESEDKWVAFQPKEDKKYAYGFIYIDGQAGLTLNYEGTFTIDDAGKFIPEKLANSMVKYRLENNSVKVAFIPADKFSELKVEEIPVWLGAYKKDTNAVERLYHWGFMYNGWEQCAKALTYLERAYKTEPSYKGLEVEMAFSYNCLGQYDKAISVLKEALKAEPTNPYIHKELVYAQVKSGMLRDAAKSTKNAIAVCVDTQYNGEMTYNLLHEFFEKKDKKNFDLWITETKKWNAKNENLLSSIKIMETGW